MRLMLINFSLGMGGAERVLVTMANYWAERGAEIIVVTLDDAPSFYPLDRRARHVPLGVAAPSSRFHKRLHHAWQRLLAIRRTLASERPDAVISFQTATNVAVLAASLGLGLPIHVSERIDPKSCPSSVPLWLQHACYRLARTIVTQTHQVRGYFPRRLRQKCHVIGNPVLEARQTERIDLGPGKHVVMLGRLAHDKRVDLALQAFQSVAEEHPSWRMTIVGDGPLRQSLEALSHKLGLADRVTFAGSQSAPSNYLLAADLFISSSRAEGFPNALCEAMACGLAVIATDCPSGPAEIIAHGINGWLIPSEDLPALTAAMRFLMDNAELRARLAAQATLLTTRFGLSAVMNAWETALSVTPTAKKFNVA